MMDSNELPPKRSIGKAHRARREPTSDEIAERAYQIHMEHGGLHGHDVEDWLQAERELLDEMEGAA